MEKEVAVWEEKIVLIIQVAILIFFYLFGAGVITFVLSVVYRSWMNNDAWVHAIVIASIIIPVFLLLTFVVTMIFVVTIKEGQRKGVRL
jgi:pilus assembly protein TadC